MQLTLIDGFYKCDDCHQTVNAVQKLDRFWLCANCFAAIELPQQVTLAIMKTMSPDDARALQQQTIERMSKLIHWKETMFELNPHRRPRQIDPKIRPFVHKWDESYADSTLSSVCSCGRQSDPYNSSRLNLLLPLYHTRCEWCRLLESLRTTLHWYSVRRPDWDDETILDDMSQNEVLYKTLYRRMWEIGMLPNELFRIRLETVKNSTI